MQLLQDRPSSEKWRVQIAEWRKSLALPSGVRVWSHLMEAKGLNVTERVGEILEIVAAVKLVESGVNILQDLPFSHKKELLKHVYCDVSQNPKFKSHTNQEGITGCLTTSTLLYSFGRDRVVLPVELAMIQGHRRGFKFPPEMPSSKIRDLMGEGMNLPCLGTVVWCLYLTKGLI